MGISYEEVIYVGDGITRKNLKIDKRVWNITTNSIFNYFNIVAKPTDIKDFILLNIDSNIGTFEFKIQPFGIPSKKYEFKVDLNKGEII